MTNCRLNRALIFSLAAATVFAPAVCRGQQPISGYTISLFAGTPGSRGFNGDGDQANLALLNSPAGLAVDSTHQLYIVDSGSARIRLVQTDGVIITVAGSKYFGFGGDEGKATSASLDAPCGVVLDSAGNYYIGDSVNGVVRRVDGNSVITTAVGMNVNAGTFSGDGGLATNATMNHPCGVAFDKDGDIYVADTLNHRIRKVTVKTSIINTVAGDGNTGISPDGILAVNAQLNSPRAVRFDKDGNMYIADTLSHRIRKVDVNGVITTVAGTGLAGYSGDGGLATQARLNAPKDFILDGAGNIYIADTNNNRIRVVNATTGVITTIAGTGAPSYSGDGGPALQASLSAPTGLALDTDGAIYVSDADNHLVRKLTPPSNPGALPAINPGGVLSAGAFGAFTSVAPGSWVEIYGTALGSTTRSWTTNDFRYLLAPTSLDGTSVKVGGQDAFISYVSPTQINAQIPSNVPTGMQTLTVSTTAGASAIYNIQVNALQPGLLQPPAFSVGGTSYTAATFPDGAFALPTGAVAGVASRPAKPGDTITLWGIGFGDVAPYVQAGYTAVGETILSNQLRVMVGGVQATLTYAGLAPQTVGLYQMNLIVPNVPDNLATPLTFTLNGIPGSQALSIAVKK